MLFIRPERWNDTVLSSLLLLCSVNLDIYTFPKERNGGTLQLSCSSLLMLGLME